MLLIILLVAVAAGASAQPAKRRTTTSNEAAQQRPGSNSGSAPAASDRAAMLFPVSDEMPEDVVWRRDIYRQLDLTLDKNAPLYYPVEPQGQQCNLFTYLFRLFLTGRVPAYNYRLDGNESFDQKDKISDVKELLERYYIYYEEKDGRYTVADNDVPSAFVKRYYIKESVYLDQRTGTTRTKVTAICPILLETDDFGGETAAPKPLFWMKYDDVAAYLTRLPIMASNYNNVTRMTADDFFTLNYYEGKIYKTSNMQGRTLADYCKTDSAMKAEQQRIEKQLADFQNGVWHIPAPADTLQQEGADSVAAKTERRTPKANAKQKVTAEANARRTVTGATTAPSKQKTQKQKEKKSKPASSSGNVVSVRRERR